MHPTSRRLTERRTRTAVTAVEWDRCAVRADARCMCTTVHGRRESACSASCGSEPRCKISEFVTESPFREDNDTVYAQLSNNREPRWTYLPLWFGLEKEPSTD